MANQNPYYRRKDFWLALACGPLAWGVGVVAMGVTTPGWPLLAPGRFLLLVLIYPVLEEIVFRGGMQGELSHRLPLRFQWHIVSMANIITSLLFATLHWVVRADALALLVFFPSLIFGYFRDRDASWVPGAILHSFYNLGFLWLFYSPY